MSFSLQDGENTDENQHLGEPKNDWLERKNRTFLRPPRAGSIPSNDR